VFNRNERENRMLLLECIIHASDLHNPLMEFEISRKWSHLVVQEFNCQYKLEKENNLATQEFMAHPPQDEVALAKLQINFIDFVVAPLWTTVSDFFPPLAERATQMESNRERWNQVLEKQNSSIKK